MKADVKELVQFRPGRDIAHRIFAAGFRYQLVSER